MLTLETKLLRFIQKNPGCRLEQVLGEFSEHPRLEILALLASLEEQNEICCLEDECEGASFTAAKSMAASAIQATYKAIENVAQQGVKAIKLVSGLNRKQEQKNKVRIEELEYLLDYEFDAYKCSHYQVELMLLQGYTLGQIAFETGYSEVWLKQLARQFQIGLQKQHVEVQVLPAQAQLREQLDAILPLGATA